MQRHCDVFHAMQDRFLELDLDLAGGVTLDRIKDYLRTCRLSYTAWVAEVVK